MPFSRTPLPYAPGALTPVFSATTVNGLYNGPHQTFVNNGNATLGALQTARNTNNYANIATLQDDLSEYASGTALFNVFWNSMGPAPQPGPSGTLLARINMDFGSLAKLQDQLTAAANAVVGDGFAMLVWGRDAQQLLVATTTGVDQLGQWGSDPIMAIDLFANAWTPNYPANRAAYVTAWWSVVDWNRVQVNYNNVL